MAQSNVHGPGGREIAFFGGRGWHGNPLSPPPSLVAVTPAPQNPTETDPRAPQVPRTQKWDLQNQRFDGVSKSHHLSGFQGGWGVGGKIPSLGPARVSVFPTLDPPTPLRTPPPKATCGSPGRKCVTFVTFLCQNARHIGDAIGDLGGGQGGCGELELGPGHGGRGGGGGAVPSLPPRPPPVCDAMRLHAPPPGRRRGDGGRMPGAWPPSSPNPLPLSRPLWLPPLSLPLAIRSGGAQ